MAFQCNICDSRFQQRRNLRQHQREQHNVTPANSTYCALINAAQLIQTIGQFTLFLLQRALSGYIRSYQVKSQETLMDPPKYFDECYGLINSLIGNTLADWKHGLKLLMSLHIKFIRSTDTDETISAHFNSSQRIILQGSDIGGELKDGLKQIIERIEKFTQKGSGWTIDNILHLDLNIAKFQVLRGSCGSKTLPKYVQHKKAVINVKSNDFRCFMWSVLASLHPMSEHSDRYSRYVPFIKNFDFDCISYPVKLKDISRFENANNISVNVFGLDENIESSRVVNNHKKSAVHSAVNIYPLYISKKVSTKECDLLLHDNHYTCIRSLDKLLFDQNNRHDRKFFCRRCLTHQYSEAALEEHKIGCIRNDPARTIMPNDKEKILKFKNIERMQKSPLTIYADFECILKPVIQDEAASISESYTRQYQTHIPCGYGLITVLDCGCAGAEKKVSDPIIYRGEDAVERFLEKTVQISNLHAETNNTTIHMTSDDWDSFNTATICYLCAIDFTEAHFKVKDHCHICGKFRGAAHARCNIGFRLKRDIPVFFHNLRRYDSHLIMQEIASICQDHGLDIDCIPKGIDDYLCFSITKFVKNLKRSCSTAESSDEQQQQQCKQQCLWKLKFLDSIQFLPSSLATLVDNLKTKGKDNFSCTLNFMGEKSELFLRKGCYPYEYFNSFIKFEETSLPPKESFYSSLTDEHISEEDYQHAKIVWAELNIKTLGEYHDWYLTTDVLLLCDVFENFRSFCLQHFSLDPTHYITLPSFGWDACLKKTAVELELIQDVNMYNFFERGIRGGVSMISHRYAKANHPLLPDFNPDLLRSFIMYLDANNLYGTSMVQKLPVDGFHFLCREEIDNIDWKTVDCNGDVGWVLEVDLDYPSRLHSFHNDYPLAPEQIVITDDMLSPYCKKLKSELCCISGNCSKLTPNLMNKTKYIVHIKNLQLYLSLDLCLMKVHRVVAFNQREWMVEYIDFNTQMRKEATSAFEKDLFKLLNNAVFGKTMENVRDYVDVKLTCDESYMLKWVGNPRFKYASIFNEDLVAIMLQKSSVKLCKPISIGFTVLELSKHLMYNFHYNFIKQEYGDKATLLFTDTDSLCYAIQTNDIYKDMEQHMDLFDTSDYPVGHYLQSDVNKKVLGKMKDETNGIPIDEFVGLRSKMYSIKVGADEKKRAKGVKKNVVKNHLKHVNFKTVLFEKTSRKDIMKMIRNSNHNLYTVIQKKTSLSSFDDKRYILDDGYTTLAYGHTNIV